MTANVTPITPHDKLETRETWLGLKLLINRARSRKLTREEIEEAFKAIDRELDKQ